MHSSLIGKNKPTYVVANITNIGNHATINPARVLLLAAALQTYGVEHIASRLQRIG